MHSLLGVPMLIASIIGILLFAVLTIYGRIPAQVQYADDDCADCEPGGDPVFRDQDPGPRWPA